MTTLFTTSSRLSSTTLLSWLYESAKGAVT